MNTPHNENDRASDLDELDLDFAPNGTIGDLGTELAADDDVRPHYLRAQWIAETISALRHARYDSGQSQQDIAGALGTRQPAIARLERSEDISLGRIWDYLHACGKAPLPLVIADANDISEAQQGNESGDSTTPPGQSEAEIRTIRERQRRVG